MLKGRVIDQLQQNLLVGHHASAATDKIEANRPRELRVGTAVREIDVVVVHAPQAVRHPGKGERSGAMAHAIPMVTVFEMGAKVLTQDKNMIKHASDTVEQHVPWRDQLHIRQLSSILQHHFVGPFHIAVSIERPRCRIAKKHKQIPAKLTCESFTEKPQFWLSLLCL